MNSTFFKAIITILLIAGPAMAKVMCADEFDKGTYATEAVLTQEVFEGENFEVVRFPKLNYYKKYFSYDFKINELFTLNYDKFFAKVIKPAILKDWSVYRYKVREFVSPTDNQILIGIDKNHAYLLIYDNQTQKYVRADAGPNVEFSIINDTKAVATGIFLKFEGLSDKNYKNLTSFIKEDNKFMTCVHGACEAFKKAGVDIEYKDKAVKTSAQLLKAMISKNINISDPNVKVEIFTLDQRPMSTQINESYKVSKINVSVLQRKVSGYLILVKSFGHTMTYWFLNKINLVESSPARRN